MAAHNSTMHLMPNNLPLQLTSFVGREREMAAVKERLEQSRLVTLTGAGGCGKTRLALQVASDALDAYPDGTWVIDLAPLSDEALVPHAVLAALGVAEAPGRPILDQLIDVLAPRRVLLVLDNCEHLVEGCARLVHVLLHACPRLTILATSREMLGVAGEAAWRVPSLALPDSIPSRSSAATLSPSATMRAAAVARQSQLDPEALLAYEGVRLFVERAALVQSEFTLTRENAPAVLEICRRLDGMPLALELAAARVRVLSVEQIAERLTDRFRLLTGGSRTALRRQQTLRALIDWSYDLLGEPERALLRRLAVFAGGWTLDAAEQVCATGDRAIQDYEVLDLLTELVDKSLVVAEAQAEQGGEAHYRLLETVRQYAEEKLLDAGEAEVVRTRHAAYYTELAEEAAPQLRRHDAVQWMERLRREHDNLRGALQWAEATGNAEQGLQAAGALHIFWQAIHRTEGRAWIERLLALPGESVRPATRGRALLALSVVAALLRDAATAQAAADEALRLA